MPTLPYRIACAAGFSGDRLDAARPLVDTLIRLGGPACLMFETLAERTLALAQIARKADPNAGFEPLLAQLLRPVLADCLAHHIPIVGNFGAAHPAGAARCLMALAAELGLPPPRIAVVWGDDLLAQPRLQAPLERALGEPLGPGVVSANAYLGAQAIADALRAGAQIVVAGRVADPALALGPAQAHFGWDWTDWDRLAGATMAGHLLECGAQVTGGYFADPGLKDVPGLATLGYPIAEIQANGACVITKPPGSGGRIDRQTVCEQLLYEVHDPAAYLTPDVVCDLSAADITELGPDRVRLNGVRGHPRPPTLKVHLCHPTGWLAEAEIGYAGARAEGRARLAAQVLRERLPQFQPLRLDLIGALSLWGDDAGRRLEHTPDSGARDVRLRAAGRQVDRAEAERLIQEVGALYTCGPAGGGGVRSSLRPTLGSRSTLLDRSLVPSGYTWAAPELAP